MRPEMHNPWDKKTRRMTRTIRRAKKARLRKPVERSFPFAISNDGAVKVEWVDLGEGIFGDYDPSDPKDIPLLRYDAYVNRKHVNPEEYDDNGLMWLDPENSSFCTTIGTDTDKADLIRLATSMANDLAECVRKGVGWKFTAEMLTYITI
jgi:hypothetical protein